MAAISKERAGSLVLSEAYLLPVIRHNRAFRPSSQTIFTSAPASRALVKAISSPDKAALSRS